MDALTQVDKSVTFNANINDSSREECVLGRTQLAIGMRFKASFILGKEKFDCSVVTGAVGNGGRIVVWLFCTKQMSDEGLLRLGNRV